MLFLGTAKYPNEQFVNFVFKHGGRYNGVTTDEHTKYFFDVDTKAFEEGLDRFAQFFVHPLFNGDSTAREMEAVDSEHSKNLQLDARRNFGVLRATASPNHPLSKFSTGIELLGAD